MNNGAVYDNSGDWFSSFAYQDVSACFDSSGINLANILTNFFNAYSDLSYGVTNVNQNNINIGLDDLSAAWGALYGMAANCDSTYYD